MKELKGALRSRLGEQTYIRLRTSAAGRLFRGRTRWSLWGYLGAYNRNDLDHKYLVRNRLAHIVQVDAPLVLISQAERSGGTLLGQLFDGHPELHVHPGELHIGHPAQANWPKLHPREDWYLWFRTLLERKLIGWSRDGFRKYGRGAERSPQEYDTFPFLFMPALQKKIFKQCVSSSTGDSARAILDGYMTSFFNAWLDYQNLYSPHKKFVVGFVPKMSLPEENVEAFFGAYPDGRLLSIIRDPMSWCVSHRGHVKDPDKDLQEVLPRWERSVEAMVRNKERYKYRVYLLSFEALLGETESTMRSLSEFLGIRFDATLLEPTFNGMPIKASSSYADNKEYGVIKTPLSRHKQMLTDNEVEYISRRALPLYEQTLKLVDS